jgi:hypothetical protein
MEVCLALWFLSHSSLFLSSSLWCLVFGPAQLDLSPVCLDLALLGLVYRVFCVVIYHMSDQTDFSYLRPVLGL